MCNRSSTNGIYHHVWKGFNSFLLQSDRKPNSWEERMSLYGAYLVDKGVQSTTLKSYTSAIKYVLMTDGFDWDDKKVFLHCLTSACRITNDRIKTRFLIKIGMLEMLLFEIHRKFNQQPFLEMLYKAVLALGYYGLLESGWTCTRTTHYQSQRYLCWYKQK